jgi:ribA/ribD-fused uncharacterized protein
MATLTHVPGIRKGWSDNKHEQFILFYHGNLFSNFYVCKFNLGGVTFNCAEQCFHYLKAMHFNDRINAALILATKSPTQHKALGRQVSPYDEEEWSAVREGYMKRTLMAKFRQNCNLLLTLRETGDATLVEASPTDFVWGVGWNIHSDKCFCRAEWRGKNGLGNALMAVRSSLR